MCEKPGILFCLMPEPFTQKPIHYLIKNIYKEINFVVHVFETWKQPCATRTAKQCLTEQAGISVPWFTSDWTWWNRQHWGIWKKQSQWTTIMALKVYPKPLH
jgi:hypothetical protein